MKFALYKSEISEHKEIEDSYYLYHKVQQYLFLKLKIFTIIGYFRTTIPSFKTLLFTKKICCLEKICIFNIFLLAVIMFPSRTARIIER